MRNQLRFLGLKKTIYILLGVIIAVGILYFFWQKYKYRIIEDKIVSTVAEETDRLYIIKYDSLSFNEATGNASIKNIHIYPDTFKIKNRNGENLPYILLDINIEAISLRGVKTVQALSGKQMIGDSVIIDNPVIILSAVRPINKFTKIDVESEAVYKQILGNLNLIKVDYVLINNINVHGNDFYTKEKNYDLGNGKIELNEVIIDSAHNNDPDRVLFCKQAAFTIDSFTSFNSGRKESLIAGIHFSGAERTLSFKEILLNRFTKNNPEAIKLIEAEGLTFSGVNTDAVVKHKDIIVDSITCKKINFYEMPAKKLKIADHKHSGSEDTTGFLHSYGVSMGFLSFPNVDFISSGKSKYNIGNIAIKINEVKADEIIKVKRFPMQHSKEVEFAVNSLSLKSKDNHYDFIFGNIVMNTLRKQLNIASLKINPYLNEIKFAKNENFQKDRYEVLLQGITLKGIETGDLFDEKLIATELVINNTNAKIYRDLNKPLQEKSKVGNYPSQMLVQLDMPVNIKNATLANAYIEYKEKQVKVDSTGLINFSNSNLKITNITNIPEEIKRNNALNINFETRVLKQIPLKGNFKFFLDGKQGDFLVNGHISGFDPVILNKVSIPMALIRIREGDINEINFHLKGNNLKAGGELVMKYDGLKVDVLKQDKETSDIKKRGLFSLFANIIVKNSNPNNGDLRIVNPSYERNIYKSFFNLVWKTIFEGMKITLGLP